MISRFFRSARGKKPPDSLQQAIHRLPKPVVREGLKKQMLESVLAEARLVQTAKSKKRLRLALPTFRYTMPFVGLVVAAALTFVLLPDIPRYHPDDQTKSLVIGAHTDEASSLDQEIAEQKELEQQRLWHQVIPHGNGQYIGEGVEITIHDEASVLARKGVIAGDLQSDLDLYRLIQEIYLNGGQLVAINGIMVEPYTEIVTSGRLVKVRDRRVQSPYTIKVIGDRGRLSKKLSDAHSFLMQLKQQYAMDVQVKPSPLVTIEDL